MRDLVLSEAKRLHDLGFAIHWLHPKSKRPVESGWTTGPRKDWEYLTRTYKKGFNVGVRLGEPSKIGDDFLSVIDVDVKSTDAKHRKEVATTLRDFTKNLKLPEVKSGRGNGSKHYYILTPKPVTPYKAMTSKDIVKVSMPSVQPSKKELKLLTPQELEQGIRLRPAWEIGVMGQGQQVVLPPSIHPDSKRPYAWEHAFEVDDASQFNFDWLPKPEVVEKSVEPVENVANDSFQIEPVELSWLPMSEKVKDMIITGAGVEDRSAALLPAAHALLKAGLTRNEILTVLTDPNNFLGQTGYNHAQTNSRMRAAKWVWKYSVKKVYEERSAEAIFNEPIKPAKELSFDEMAQSEEAYETHHWTDDLDVADRGTYQPSLKNVVDILKHEVSHDFVKRDLFAFRDAYSQNTPWGGVKGASITDEDLTQIKLWLGRNWGFEPSVHVVNEALSIVSVQNAYDPVVDWLDGLPEWDGVERLNTWLEKYFEANIRKDITGAREYHAQVFRKWIFGMVLRAYRPGAHFPWMPIFEGAQGIGKSSFGRILVGEKYFLDWLPDLHDKDASLSLQGAWAVEMGELASMRKNELEVIKAFLTRKIDKFRPPHGKKTIESHRRCVFFGTTNNATYLKDDSGNRRFKPLEVGRLDFEQLHRDREQLFAEAKFLFDSGFETESTVELEGAARAYEKLIQREKMVHDESDLMAEEIVQFYTKQETLKDDEKFNFFGFSARDLFTGQTYSAPLHNWRYDSRNVQFAGKALKKLGAKKKHTTKGNRWILELKR